MFLSRYLEKKKDVISGNGEIQETSQAHTVYRHVPHIWVLIEDTGVELTEGGREEREKLINRLVKMCVG